MAQNLINVEIPETLSPYLYTMKDGKTMDDKVTISIVVGLFVSGIITLEKAAEFLIDTIGILGILLLAKKKRLINCIKPDFDNLRANGYRISDELYD